MWYNLEKCHNSCDGQEALFVCVRLKTPQQTASPEGGLEPVSSEPAHCCSGRCRGQSRTVLHQGGGWFSYGVCPEAAKPTTNCPETATDTALAQCELVLGFTWHPTPAGTFQNSPRWPESVTLSLCLWEGPGDPDPIKGLSGAGCPFFRAGHIWRGRLKRVWAKGLWLQLKGFWIADREDVAGSTGWWCCISVFFCGFLSLFLCLLWILYKNKNLPRPLFQLTQF